MGYRRRGGIWVINLVVELVDVTGVLAEVVEGFGDLVCCTRLLCTVVEAKAQRYFYSSEDGMIS